MVLKPMMSVGSTTGTGGYGAGGRMPSAPDILLSAGPPRPSLGEGGTQAPAQVPQRSAPAQEGSVAEPAARQRRRGVLARTVVSEVVPRLVLAHREPQQAPPQPRAASQPRVRRREVAAFAGMLLVDDVPGAEGVVAGLRARGVALEAVCLDLMAPAARRMGEAWLDDSTDYTSVTLGMWRMQAILRGMDKVFQPQADVPRGSSRRALIVAMPGATHTFGTDLVAGFLRLAGWEVCNEPVPSGAALTELVRTGGYAVVGLSASCAADLRKLAELIGLVRRAAGRRPVGILIGGSVVAEEQQQRDALRLGGDAVAADARHAVQQAEGLLALLVNRA